MRCARRNRGTEFAKPPEMLRVDMLKPGEELPGAAADVWGLGCLLYELVTGELLFFDANGDWSSYFVRLTTSDQVLG